ncbi:hypothetical protein VP01_2986g1 [Puccinia sorghi]|uniref:GAG-pre-integrase domain-containing protein n=1 Tax=Puccinia sorghi TaxID=27349 RepID=A0A0L6V0G8_9BASI|nr:hypothetical protein VP01_2986g1 [Puccinia sorghi]
MEKDSMRVCSIWNSDTQHIYPMMSDPTNKRNGIGQTEMGKEGDLTGKMSLRTNNCCILLSKDSNLSVSKDGKLVLKGLVNHGLFSVDNPDGVGKAGTQVVANIPQEKETLMELHEKLGHLSIQRIEPLLNNSISKTEKANFEYKSCVLSKITKQPFKERSKTFLKPYERLHLDLIGPIDPESSLKH